MKTIYIDSDCKCHVTNDGTMFAVETDFFDDKCDAFIEGHRFVPSGMVWVRSDGEKFVGGMISPWIDFDLLDVYQRHYERELIQNMRSTLADMVVSV
jgi:hypothetical protein